MFFIARCPQCWIPSLFVIMCLASSFLSTSPASINTTRLPPDEVDALREIGRKLGKIDWDFEKDPCSNDSGWIKYELVLPPGTYEDNVTCHCEPNGTLCNVVSISLKRQNLQGILSPEFVRLPYLQNIDLSRNFLNGTIPPIWGSMKQLLNIYLTINRLSGSIPKELGSITTLKALSVEHNLLSGEIPEELGNLSSIETLFLNNNNFNGELPGSLAKLTALKEIKLCDNNLSGKIPNFIQGWTSLKRLRIQASGLEGPIPPGVALLTNLWDLRITDLKGPDTICPPFHNMTSLNNTILRSCNLIGGLPELFGSTHLDILDLSFNKLNGSIFPDSFGYLQNAKSIFLTGNLLSGDVPNWMLTSDKNIDLSYNNFTFQRSTDLRCQMTKTNLFGFSSTNNVTEKVACLNNDCPTNRTSLYINCGGTTLMDGNKSYEQDIDPGGASYFSLSGSNWGFSNTGRFMDNNTRNFIMTNTSRLSMKNSELYIDARSSPLSLTYYGFCMHNGSYNISLHFAEIIFTDSETYYSLGRRVFDIYIQGILVEKDFNIVEEAGGVGKEIVKTYPANVKTTLEIRLFWAGKGTTGIPFRGEYGPLISAISVDPDFQVLRDKPSPENGNGVSAITIVGVVVGVVCGIFLILGILWWRGCLQHKDTMDPELDTGSFTLRQIKAATKNFDIANKIGEGGFGSVYKGVLSDGTVIAVKQLSSKSKQGNREFLNELSMISALQHPHLVKLYGCCIEGNQLLLAYEYMENNSLARALFGPEKWQLELDWGTRYMICIGIARGLAFLHEESRFKIVHRDIKATNVLLDKSLNPKISDFGLAKLDEEDSTHIKTRIAGTYGYMAPEYALRGYLTDKADVYSYGIVLLEIVSGTANTVDRTKENHFILLDRVVDLNNTGKLMELVDPRLGSEYKEEEVMVVTNIALLCTSISPADRPAMSLVVSMLEGRTITQEITTEQSNRFSEITKNPTDSMGEIDDSSTSARDLYPVGPFSQYMEKRENETLLS